MCHAAGLDNGRMCRFTFYLGPKLRLSSLVVEPTHSIIDQSFHSRSQEEPLNGDGFGIAWYAPGLSTAPALFRSVTPAWNNTNLLELAQVVESPLIFAHVRAATKHGGQSEANCHPFRAGRHAFMHNGDIGDFAKVRRPLLESLGDAAFHAIQGTTDSEHLFALAMDELDRAAGSGAEKLANALTAAIARTVAIGRQQGTAAPSYLNVAFSDGECAVASRFTTEDGYDGESLYVHTGRVYVCSGGVCRMLSPERGRGCVIVSSEPLSDDPGWDMMPRNSLVLIHHDGTVSSRAIAI
jgi:glutamine amidotransferase